MILYKIAVLYTCFNVVKIRQISMDYEVKEDRLIGDNVISTPILINIKFTLVGIEELARRGRKSELIQHIDELYYSHSIPKFGTEFISNRLQFFT